MTRRLLLPSQCRQVHASGSGASSESQAGLQWGSSCTECICAVVELAADGPQRIPCKPSDHHSYGPMPRALTPPELVVSSAFFSSPAGMRATKSAARFAKLSEVSQNGSAACGEPGAQGSGGVDATTDASAALSNRRGALVQHPSPRRVRMLPVWAGSF